ncbi:histone deacetylase complex subunit SAP25 [Rhinoderma darwinii]|uniref:histone deacetylase complex subunit SAP25 n=1 Tax=Rhinoderma darwinii TaxID=43563 RepID=UPI003F6637C3
MSCCDHSDCESIDHDEDDFSGDGDFSSTDEPEASPHQSQPLAQCHAPVHSSVHSDMTPLPVFTSRALYHPTFEAYYAAVAIHQNVETPEMQMRREEGFTVNTGEYFYTDPLLSPGHRVYNCLLPASHNVFGCFRLQTPPPIMSSSICSASCQDSAAPVDPLIVPSDEVEVSGGALYNEGCIDVDSLPPGSAPHCLLPPVMLGCSVTVSSVSSPIFYTTSELEAVCGLLRLSTTSAPPHR